MSRNRKKNICNNSRTRIFGNIKKYFGEWNAQNGPLPFLQKISPKKLKKNPVVPLKTIYENQVQETDEKYLPPAFSPVQRAMSRTREKNICYNLRNRIFGKIKNFFWGLERSKLLPTVLTVLYNFQIE